MANSLPGKLIGVTLDGTYYRCQTDAVLTLTAAVTEDDPCKPDQGEDTNGITWVTRTVDSKDWNITFSAKEFADGLGANGSALAQAFITGGLAVEAQFMTNPDVTDDTIATDFLYEGSGLLTSLKINAPQKGTSTYDAQIDGNGPLVLTQTPRTT